MKVTVIIAAAGSGKRFGGDTPKQYLKINGVTVLEKALNAFCSFWGGPDAGAKSIAGAAEAATRSKTTSIPAQFIIVSDNPAQCKSVLQNRDFIELNGIGQIPLIIIQGGAERQDSIRNALAKATGDFVLIHDAARPFVSSTVIGNIIAALESGAASVIPGVRPKNTIRTESGTLDRSSLYEVQTPQGFITSDLKVAYEKAYAQGFTGTDDAGVFEATGGKTIIVQGDYENIKITTKEDMPKTVRFGNGYDVHRLVEGRPLMLGCTKIPYEKGLLGHSDADVLAHAMADAILGAASLPDIGRIFPDNSPETEGMAGSEILRQVAEMVRKKGYTIMMVDATVIAEKPKLMPHIESMRKNTAKALGIDIESVSIKATTEENMSDVSRNGMAAIATCVLTGN